MRSVPRAVATGLSQTMKIGATRSLPLAVLTCDAIAIALGSRSLPLELCFTFIDVGVQAFLRVF